MARVGFRRRPVSTGNGAAPERTDAILESIGDGVFATDCSGTIRLWNRAAERVVGCPARRAIGSPCETVMRLRIGGQTLDCSHGCPLAHVAGEPMEVTRVGNGRTQPLLVTVAPVIGEGNTAEVVHSFRDISTLKQAEEAQTMFLATASHELKTPLTVILGYTQSLQAGIIPSDQLNQTLDIIETRTRELSRIVDRLLMTGRIQGGRMTLTLEAVETTDLLRDRTEAFATAAGIPIVAEMHEALPPVVGDPEALKTVLDHLLENAVKYSPAGGDITVRARRAGTAVEIDVIDNGIGMSEDEAARCFDRFWQAESSDVRRFGGTGIGLYIVRTLVEAMGGSVRVRSRHGEGSVFTVLLRPYLETGAAADDTHPRVGERIDRQGGHASARRPLSGGAQMKTAAGVSNVVLGGAYLYLGLIIAEDLRRGWREMGFSHFGIGLGALAFTCGPHHLVHGVHTLLEARAGGPLDLATVLVGVPPGLLFLYLRTEALMGGRGDRFVSGTPAWLAAAPTIGGVYATALIAAALQTRGDFAYRPQMAANLLLIALYLTIGSYIVRTQIRNRLALGGWSVSGLSLAAIFPTCALMHVAYTFYAASGVYADVDWHGLTVDWISVPAAIYFLWVVRELYGRSIRDWNRFSFDSVPDRKAAVVAW